ncbi:citrate/2-methylcitrate synthase [Candidatus Omnitrophota bacterium]
MKKLFEKTQSVTELLVKAAGKAREETSNEPEPKLTNSVQWPVSCTVGPGLEGAIACESKIGYVNGAKGCLIYRGYDIFDLCINSTFEEVSFLLLHGKLPIQSELSAFKKHLVICRATPETLRLLLNFPIEKMSPMAALRMGTNLMRQEFTYVDQDSQRQKAKVMIATDEDSIPMETTPKGEAQAVYEVMQNIDSVIFDKKKEDETGLESAVGFRSCYHLLSGSASLAAAINRIRQGHYPIEPDPHLSHAANLLYMMTGKKPDALQERLMDIILILHADHGMNASTFATMVVASTLSDIYFSVGSGIAALNGSLHGGANERVLRMLREIGHPKKVKDWYNNERKQKRKIPGFGHRVYKAYDPRARVLSPLVEYLAQQNSDTRLLFETAKELEREVESTLGRKKKIFPNVDFYSGIIYGHLGIAPEMFTSLFAVSRVAGWTARVIEYLKNNRIFRPRAVYTGPFDRQYSPIEKRS